MSRIQKEPNKTNPQAAELGYKARPQRLPATTGAECSLSSITPGREVVSPEDTSY